MSRVTFSSLFFLLPKAFPNDEKERFKLVLVAGEMEGRLFDKPGARKPTEDLVVGWNAID